MTSSGGPEERVRVLERLVAAATPVASVVSDLALFEWNSDEELITLERGHVVSVLERRLAGELSEADCILWADTVEMREDIRYEPGHEPAIAEFLFEATFQIPGHQPLTAGTAEKWLRYFRGEKPASEAHAIWNRACSIHLSETGTEPGDRALRLMIVADGVANNGGLLHSIEALNDELDEVVSAYRFFGLHAVADVMVEVSRRLAKYESVSDESALDALESEADDRYFALAGGDTLFEAFEATFALRPEMFSPAEVEGVVSRETDTLDGAVRTFISQAKVASRQLRDFMVEQGMAPRDRTLAHSWHGLVPQRGEAPGLGSYYFHGSGCEIGFGIAVDINWDDRGRIVVDPWKVRRWTHTAALGVDPSEPSIRSVLERLVLHGEVARPDGHDHFVVPEA